MAEAVVGVLAGVVEAVSAEVVRIRGPPAGRNCPQCEGTGGLWAADEECLVAAHRVVLYRYPDAGAPGGLSPGGVSVD